MTTLSNTYITCMVPFSYRERSKFKMYDALKQNKFEFFSLDQLHLQQKYYGSVTVLHEELDQHFLPYIERRMFPKQEREDSFLRYSKEVGKMASLSIHGRTYPFQVLSADVVICPFQLGFVTLRIALPGEYELHAAMEFMHHIRVLEPKLPEEKGIYIDAGNDRYNSVSDFTFDRLCPFLRKYLNHDAVRDGYFGSLPFFEDERMLLSAYTEASNHPDTREMYSLSQLDGLDRLGRPFLSAESDAYMTSYLKERVDLRFDPKTNHIITEHVFMCVAMPVADEHLKEVALRRFMSVDYYQLLLHYFYKLTLLKLSYQYSAVSVLHDQEHTEQLIEQISRFSATYYFQEVSSRSSGMELSSCLRRVFKLEEQYREVKNTLESLYRNQESSAGRKQNSLLFMLTIFTVVSGIYGMNLIIDEWSKPYHFSNMLHYTFFEWISFITAIGGIAMSITVVSVSGYRNFNLFLRKRKRKHYE